MAKSENIFVKAKAYQKLHPRTPWPECIQKCKGKKAVTGTKKRVSVAGKKKAAPAKRTVKHTVGKATTRKVSHHKAGAHTAKAEAIWRDIERLELKRQGLKAKELKDICQLEINGLHNKLKHIRTHIR